MAYMDQAKKAQLAAALKTVVPAGWKYSLAVRNHSTIVMTITEAPFDLIAALKPQNQKRSDAHLNHHYIREQFQDECVADVFEKIVAALNTGNHDRSDSMTDYFDVGWYIDLRIGRWDKPFIHKPAPVAVGA